MGMIMNRFNMFTQLRKDIKKSEDKGIDYKRFVLSGIVVHDTNDHDLIDCMSRNFVKWAEMTGEHFLFITFIHPSVEWKKSKYCHDGYWIDKDNLMVDSKFTEEDEERTIPLLRDFMDIPQSGSYLLLTDNLCSNTPHLIPISAQTIEGQLLLITKYCNEEYSGKEHFPADFKKLLKDLQAGEFSIMNSLLDVLIDFSSITSQLVRNCEEMRVEQLSQADVVINNLRAKLYCYQGEDFEERLFHLFECLEMVFKKLYEHKISHYPSFDNQMVLRSKKYLDVYSKKLLESYNYLSTITDAHAESLDYSGLTIYLGKIVENELHLSVGQMLRWAMGIDMPQYFNRYCGQRNRVTIQTGNQKVNINEPISYSRNESRQKGIPMGTLLKAYEYMYYRPDEISPAPMLGRLQELNSGLLSFLRDFCSKFRNRAGHLDDNSRQTYEGAKEAFDEFINDYLVQLYRIKQFVKGEHL